MKRLNDSAVSTVLGAILFLILTVGVISTLVVSYYHFSDASNQALSLQEATSQEKLVLKKLETHIADDIEYITRVLVQNHGTITSNIRAIYIDGIFTRDPSLDTEINPTTFINAKESIWINLPPNTLPYEETSYLAMSTERGSKTIEEEGKLKDPDDDIDDPFIPVFGPLQLHYDYFYYAKYDSSNFPPAIDSWKPAWSIEQYQGSIVWKITVTNICDKDLTITKSSCFTVVPNPNNIGQKPWYLEPSASPDGDTEKLFIASGDTVDLVFSWKTPGTQTVLALDDRLYQAKVFMTFFGWFHEDATTTSPYGQTIPFEAVMTIPPRLTIQAAPSPIAAGSNMLSTITVTARNIWGDLAPGEQIILSSTSGHLSSSLVTTNSQGIATATLDALSETAAKTATITAEWDELTKTASVQIALGTLSLSTDRSVLQAGGTLTSTIRATLQFNGVPLSGQQINFNEASGLGSLSTSTLTNALGQTTVTFTPSAASGTATITANALSNTVHQSIPIHVANALSISETTPNTITAGQTKTYAALASDGDGNSWDVTSSTTFGISVGAGGSWSGANYTSDNAGTWTVTGTFGSLTDTASLTVNHAVASSIVVTPASISITAGTSQTYVATASDLYGNTWDVTSLMSWSISAVAGGQWDGAIYTAEVASVVGNPWTVTGTYNGVSGTASLTVTHSTDVNDLVSVTLSPSTASIEAGNTQSYTAIAMDLYGNVWDVTDAISAAYGWSITADAGGHWTDNIYTAEITSADDSPWTVTGTYEGVSGSATLTVIHSQDVADLDYITVSVDPTTVIAPNIVTGTATAYDTFGNSWDVSVLAVWSIPAGNDGGSWIGNVYSSHTAGVYTVQALYEGVVGIATLTVTHATEMAYLDHITATIVPTTVAAPGQVTGTATAYDTFGNSWDVSSVATWSIPASGDGGSWSNNVYTSHTAGDYTIEASYSGKITTTTLTVNHAAAISVAVSPSTATIIAGQTQGYVATASDLYGNTWDVTGATIFGTDASAGGQWVGPIYTAEIASAMGSPWTVTGTFGSLTDTASLTVTAV